MISETKKNNEYMKVLIEDFPDSLTEAMIIAKNNSLKKSYPNFNNVVICGMGGSGIGANLVTSWIVDEIKIPIIICQDYTLPNFVNEKTLIIASSYSGNTEEIISTVNLGKEKGASIIGLCSGGSLQSFCKKWSYECIIMPANNPPRTALGFSIVQLIHVFGELGLIKKNKLIEFSAAKELLISNRDEIHLKAKRLADFINSKELIIYSETKDVGIAIRARQQFNENSKILCNHHVVPEMNHNELVGWYGGNEKYAVLFLDTNDWHSQNKKRLAFSIKTIKTKTNDIMILQAEGNSLLSRSLYLINIIDWASLYLAQKNNVDSVYIAVIDDLKASLLNHT